jgi:dihydrofolate reductase
MGKIVISDNVSLDGVGQDPSGDEGFDRGGWFAQMSGKDREAWAKVEFDEALGAEALLLGRRSYEYFATRWATRSGDWADRLRSLPKYVVSATIENLDWTNSTVLAGDAVTAASNLRHDIDGTVIVYGSRQLVHTLMRHDLVDEVRLMIHPFLLGAGDRVLGETSGRWPLRLLDARTVGDGIAYLAYEVVRDA